MKVPSTLPRSRVPPEQLLLPVEPRFIWLTLFLAWLLNLLPWGQVGGIPDLLAICLVFWSVHEPRRVGMLAAFLFGILMDVHGSARLGEHALAYTLMVYLALLIHRRLSWFSPWVQALHVLPIFFVSELTVFSIRGWLDNSWPGWWWALSSVISALLWPLAGWILQAPQRRAIDPDDTRPI
ncbi:rod shape-determining protein MreD [Pigmentiphaga sp.]|jgi:rod shape-determining protein MreD|uniref:rod shape-determining protein MreD n=1 Tax=Pigmentiphaga sp. TaxID=1977564 RepID=UPI0025FE3982|nr:rod shape-determining protein MreD [Pigmentiphaga sp.]MBX6319054.1 rod shape-determining protein MreD [Pigmentiphaga sp.]